MGLFSAKSPLEKTLEVVFPEIGLLESITRTGGSLSLHASIGSDISEKITENPLVLNTNIVWGKNGVSLAADAGTEQEKIDLSFLVSNEGAQIFSDRLLDGGYSVTFEGFMDALDQSIFAPDSGTDYALPQQMYDALRSYMESLKKEQELPALHETEKVLRAMLDAAMQVATVTEERKTVALTDKKEQLKLRTLTFDVQALSAAADVLWDEWQNNTAFYEEVSCLIAFYSDSASSDGEPATLSTPDEKMQQLHDQIETKLDALIKKWQNYHVGFRITYGVQSGYLVYISVETFEDVWVQETKYISTANVEWIFSSNPGRDPSYSIHAKSIMDEEETELFSVTYNKENDRFLLIFETAPALLGNSIHLELEGQDTVQRRQRMLLLDSLKIKMNDQTTLKLTESSLRIIMENSSRSVERIDPDINVLSMSVEQTDGLFDKVEQGFEQFCQDVNQSLAFDMFYHTYQFQVTGAIAEESPYHSTAYDIESGRFFALNIHTGIDVYDLSTMTLLETFDTERFNFSIYTSGGYLFAVGYSTDRPYVRMMDIKTLETVKLIDARSWFDQKEDVQIDGAVFDGDVLICWARNQFENKIIFYNVKTDEVIAQMSAPHIFRWEIDREDHVLIINERQGIMMYHSLTGEYLTTVTKRDYSASDDIYYAGTTFRVGADYYYSDGKRVSASELAKDRRREDKESKLDCVRYKDSDILVTREIDKNGKYYTMFYALSGDKKDAPLFLKSDLNFLEIYKIGEHTYIGRVLGTDSGWISFSLEEYIDFGI